MSAKWRALQHRHRYTYSSVVFPKPFLETLDTLPPDVSTSSNFFALLRQLASLNSTYSQLTASKELSLSFSSLLDSPGVDAEVVSSAGRLYLEILFLENSLPLHRTLISALVKSRKHLPVIERCFVSLCEEYGCQGRQGKRFLVSRAALSVMGYPKLGFLNGVVEKCSVSVALDVAAGLTGVISDVECGSRPSPAVMEQCQEALSCMYYLLQRFPSKFVSPEEAGLLAFKNVMRAIVSVMKSSAFSRDCLVAAGVSFCAALQVCMNSQELASFIGRFFFGFDSNCESFDVGTKKGLYEKDLCLVASSLPVLSRLCLLRGVLTAVPRTVLNTRFIGSGSGLARTILFDGILPELCNYCENPLDSHFNFHALTVTQICLQQIKTSMSSDLSYFSGDYEPFSEYTSNRLLRIVWNNLEDPLNQTVKQVHLIFDLFLDIQSIVLSGEGNECSGRTKLFLRKITSDLLCLGSRCKGRYVPLASLTKRLSAKALLDMRPNLLLETVYAYVEDDVCCSVTSFLKCFLECLRDECWSSHGIEKGYEVFRGFCLPPILDGLLSGISKLRSNLNTYAIPVILGVDVDSIFPMLAFISIGPTRDKKKVDLGDKTFGQCVAALVSLLKVSRSLALVEGDIEWDYNSSSIEGADRIALVCVKGINVEVPVDWFVLALTHADENLRIDAAETLFLNPKTSTLPSSLELSLMRKAVPLNMRCCSTAFQMKWTGLFRKFFSRVRTALERQMKQGCWQLILCSGWKENKYGDGAKDVIVQRAVDLFFFIKWLSCFLFYSCYPSAPYERKTMAMELMLIMIDVWPAILPLQGNGYLYPYCDEFTSSDSTLSLVGSIVDSWDKLRESSFRILLCFPTPLPGICSFDSVKKVIRWAKRLVCSTRVRESDAGALTLRLIFRKYVLELGWIVGVSVDVVCAGSPSEMTNEDSQLVKVRSPVVEYILSLIDWLRVVVEEGESDLSEACRNSFVHGVLLTLRYTFEELDWNSIVAMSNGPEMRRAMEILLELVMRITSLALWVVSADAWYLPDDMDNMVDGDDFISDLPIEMDALEPSSETTDGNLKLADSATPLQQVVMVGCWLAMKEVSLLLGTVIRKIPLPSFSVSDYKLGYPHDEAVEVETMTASDIMLDLKQLETIGNHFLLVLLKMKHNGAIDKTRAGFTALCNRLLCSNDPRLCKMTESWMEQLMERIIAKGQTVDDLLRRSAGIPAAFIAFFLAEPEGTPKKLLPRALRWLIDVAKMSLPNTSEFGNQNSILFHKNDFKELNQEPPRSMATDVPLTRTASKIRDEGVIPMVHAFNALRAAFNDTNLAADTSGFCAEALILAIQSFSSPYWEVRNSACLAYTALVRRMIGFLNVQKRQSVRRAMTGNEFFHRYPALHPFLFSELKIATDLLGNGYSEHLKSSIAKAIHPSLCPILILLSRLKPSLESSDANGALDPFLYMPFIRRCATQSNLRVRMLASRALVGLVSNEKLPTVLSEVAHGLSCGGNLMPMTGSSCTMSSSIPNRSMENENSTQPFTSYNSIHGILLQLISLLNTNCRNLTNVSKKEQILGELINVLMKCSWIGNSKSCTCPTLNSSFLCVLDNMLNIARTCKRSIYALTIRSLLLELSWECLDANNTCGLAFYDPTKIELRRQAAVSYFSCLFGGHQESTIESSPQRVFSLPALNSYKMPESVNTVDGLKEKILFCISDSVYEVRLAILKWLLHFLKSNKCDDEDCIIQQWARIHLQPTLMQLITMENNPKCIYYTLRIIFSWNLLQSEKAVNLECKETIYVGTMDCDSLFCFWDRLIALYGNMRRIKAREIIICCMGICLKQFVRLYRSFILSNESQVQGKGAAKSYGTDQWNTWAKVYGCIEIFVGLVKQHSAPSEPVNMRKATAESMVASGLLEELVVVASKVSNGQIQLEGLSICGTDEKKGFQPELSSSTNLYGLRILDIWFTCIQLLEDEDVGLRQRLSMDVQSCICSNSYDGCRGTKIVPVQVERVIESVFEFLSSIMGHWIEYFDYLSRWVLNTASYMTANGDLVRQVFDKEIDNHHEEKLLICQICCSHLEKILLNGPSSALVLCFENFQRRDFDIFLQRWRTRFARQLTSFANDYLRTLSGAEWIGGLGNHKNAFMPVYASLLGLHALLQCPSEGFPLSVELSDVHSILLSDFAEVREIIRPFLTNPLVCNLYLSVLQSHEKKLGKFRAQLDPRVGDFSVWKGFDPYFLLK